MDSADLGVVNRMDKRRWGRATSGNKGLTVMIMEEEEEEEE